jgi:hypothetical protein
MAKEKKEHVNPFGDLLCPVFAVPIVIASLPIFVVSALMRRTVPAFVVPIMASGIVRFLGGVRTVAV